MTQLQPYLKSRQHIVWDWNGTLLDDVDLAVTAIGKLLNKYNLPVIDRAQYLEMFCFPVKDYYEKLGFDTKPGKFEAIAPEFIQFYHEGIHACDLHVGTRELLEDLKGRGLKLSILSAAHEKDLSRFVKHFGIDHLFDHICGLNNHYASSKVEIGKELIRLSNISEEKTLLIGDTDHDVEVGRELGIDVILLARGHQSAERLRAIHPNVIEDL